MKNKNMKNKNKKPIPSPLTPSASSLYYDAMELLEGGATKSAFEALEILDQAYQLEPESAEVQIGFVGAYGVIGIQASAHAHIEQAYQLTRTKFPKWPKLLEWGFLENRAYLRAIHYKAGLLCNQDKLEEGLKLYKLLLKLNPNDNQGIRYLVAGFHAGMTSEDVDLLFAEGNKKQNWDALTELLETQNKKHHFWKPPGYGEE